MTHDVVPVSADELTELRRDAERYRARRNYEWCDYDDYCNSVMPRDEPTTRQNEEEFKLEYDKESDGIRDDYMAIPLAPISTSTQVMTGSGRYERGGDYIVRKRGDHIRSFVRLTVAVAILASLPWAWLMWRYSEQTERLLADKTARQARVERIVIQYAGGAKASVNIRESK